MLRSDRPKAPSGRQTVTERFVDSGLRADIVAVNKPVLPTGVAMDPSCLQYALTEAERIEFDERGYIVLEDLLTENQITDLEKACDAVDREVREERGIGPHARLTVRDVARSIASGTGRFTDGLAENVGTTRLEYPDLPHRHRLQPAGCAGESRGQASGLASGLGSAESGSRVFTSPDGVSESGVFPE